MARLTVLVAFALFAVSAWAAGIGVSEAWIRHLPGGAPAGGYLTLENQSEKAVALVGASSPEYGMVMIHKTVEEGGTAKMVPVNKVDIAAGGKVVFRPGGYHLMLMHVKRNIEVGSSIPITLEFSGGQKVTAQFRVRGPTAK